VSEAGIGGSGKIRAVAIDDLAAMAAAAKDAGNPIAVQSAYRSYATQVSTFQYWVNLSGYQAALQYSARPGHSEHQLGLAIDFKSAGGSAPWSGDWGQSPAGSWLRKHAWEFGWVQSYPKGQKSKTCYSYESWHFRYVGRDLAAAIHASGLTSREYLWSHFTTAVVPSPSASPGHPSPSPSVVPSASPGVSPEPSPSEPPSPMPSLPPSNPPSEPAAATPSATPASPAGAPLGSATIAALTALGLGVAALVAVLALSRRRRPQA
jgi:D-alanyl-D-alanine carboxypeptidase